MKISPSFLLFFCSPILCLADNVPQDRVLPAPTTSRTAGLTPEAFDYFNFAAMKKGPAGQALRERIFFELKNAPDTEKLIRILNEKYALGVPESVERAVLTKFSLPQSGNLNTAEFKFYDEKNASEKKLAEAFFNALREQAFPWEGYPENIELSGKTLPSKSALPAEQLCADYFASEMVALPKALTQNLPEAFLENAPNVLIAQTEPDAVTVVAASRMFETLPNFRKTESYTQGLANAAQPGILIYRRFPRREAKIAGLDISFPPGNFSISEENRRAKIAVDFRCRDVHEAVFMEHFFLRFKLSLLESAGKQTEATRERLLSVGSALSIVRTNATLQLRIDCDAENFPVFLKWRSTWFPKR